MEENPFATRVKPPKSRDVFSGADQCLLKNLVVEYDDGRILDSAKRDAGTKQKKAIIWGLIVEAFNRQAARMHPVTVKQLKGLYDRMKQSMRSASDVNRMKQDRAFSKMAMKTGGGTLFDGRGDNYDDDSEENIGCEVKVVVKPSETASIRMDELSFLEEPSNSIEKSFSERISNTQPLMAPVAGGEKSKEPSKLNTLALDINGSKKHKKPMTSMEAFCQNEEERSQLRHEKILQLIDRSMLFLDKGIDFFDNLSKESE